MDRISLKNMEFFGFHGVDETERKNGQTFQVDVHMYLDLTASGVSDDLTKTIDYGVVFEKIRKIVELQQFDLLEKLALVIVDTVMWDFTMIDKGEVVVRKPNVPLVGKLDCAEVSICRERK